MSNDAFALAGAAAEELRARASVDSFDVAIVLGSGWVPAADALGSPVVDVLVTELPGFAPPAAEGHAGRVR
ncbi:purine-nucleoside phosphorylase, partial [Actinomadura soli]